jgi:hypothetical protein
MWTAPLNVVRFGATTLWHFDAEERAPSTTSEATFSITSAHLGYHPDNDQTGERREGRQSSAAAEVDSSDDGSGVEAIRPWAFE